MVVGGERLVFRAMKLEKDSKPMIERSARALGVRVALPGSDPKECPGFDVYPDSNNEISPHGGMSVALDDPMHLPKMRRPRALGGEGRDPLFVLPVFKVPSALAVYNDHGRHAMIEPMARCSLDSYESALGATRDDWEPYDV